MDYKKAVQVFQLSESYTEEELKKQYKLLAKKYHPDNGSLADEDKFIEIKTAYEVLSKQGKKSDNNEKVQDGSREICPMCNGTGVRRTKIKTARGYVAGKIVCQYCVGTGMKK